RALSAGKRPPERQNRESGRRPAPIAPCLCYNANVVKRAGSDRMSKSITLAARVDADLDAELSQLAAKTGRTKSWLITEALRSFVANEQQFLAAVEEGKRAVRE